MAVGDRRHRTDVQAGSARLLLIPVVLAGAWTVVGLALGSTAAHADTGSTGGSPGITLPAVSIPHPSLASAAPAEHHARAAAPSPAPAPSVAAVQLPVKVVPKTLT